MASRCPKNRSELKRSYDLLVEAGQIAFVTFHQNYSYEDFVEGLRPTTGTEESDDRSGFRLTPEARHIPRDICPSRASPKDRGTYRRLRDWR